MNCFFVKGKKPPSDIVAQNMKFLQEQHQATLVALHLEVDSLRQRNRGKLYTIKFFILFTNGKNEVLTFCVCIQIYNFN